MDKITLYGLWEVTTEGDCEGRTTRNLGIYEGYVDDIALTLADQAYYKLSFKQAVKVIKKGSKPTNEKVIVSLQYGILDEALSFADMFSLFKDRPVVVEKNSSYRSVALISKNAEEIRTNKAMSKLSDEDKAVLGLLNE
jgi:hypothetical protein|tara:strand:- start:697 stop:1113 length:417 start_codon:yes stop_codon:yes gene_type:complete